MKTKKIISLLLAIIMTLGLSSVFVTAADTFTPNYTVSNMNGTPKIDGSYNVSEYGLPFITLTPSSGAFKPGSNNPAPSSSQELKLYVTGDENYLYVAAVLSNASKNTHSSSSGMLPLLAFTVAGYDAESGHNVPVSELGLEQYRIVRLYMNTNNTPAILSREYTGAAKDSAQKNVFNDYAGKEKKNEDYAASFYNSTYTYEYRIAWSTVPGMKNGEFKQGKPFAMTFRVNDGNANAANVAPSYYTLGGTAAANMGADNTHKNGVKTFAAGEWCKLDDKVSQFPENAPTMDASVSVDEWGEPVIVTSAQNVRSIPTGSRFDDTVVGDQRAKIYMTNDENKLYVAATLDKATATGSNTPALIVRVSQYQEGTNGLQSENGYDQFTAYRLQLNGTLVRKYNVEEECNFLQYTADSDEYSAKYDEATQTYTFELSMKWSWIPGMKEGVFNGTPIAVSFELKDGVGTYKIGNSIATDMSKDGYKTKVISAGAVKLDINGQQDKAAAKVQDTYYALIADAFNALKANETITILNNNAAPDTIVLPEGSTLDLNGKILSMRDYGLVAVNAQVIDSQNGVAVLKANDKDNLEFSQNNEQLPLYDATNGDNSGYRFYDYTFEYKVVEDGANEKKYAIRIGLPSEEAYNLLDDDDNYQAMSIEFNLTGMKPIPYSFQQETVAKYTKMSSDGLVDEKTYGITLKVTGFETLEKAGIKLESVYACLTYANLVISKPMSVENV